MHKLIGFSIGSEWLEYIFISMMYGITDNTKLYRSSQFVHRLMRSETAYIIVPQTITLSKQDVIETGIFGEFDNLPYRAAKLSIEKTFYNTEIPSTPDDIKILSFKLMRKFYPTPFDISITQEGIYTTSDFVIKAREFKKNLMCISGGTVYGGG